MLPAWVTVLLSASCPIGHCLTTSSGAQPKKQRSVPTLEEKLAVLDLLRAGMSVSNVTHKYGHNEFSIYAIKIQEREIRQAVASSAPITAKVTSQVHDKTLVKAEKALNLWLEDKNRKHLIREDANRNASGLLFLTTTFS
uniref:HTH psq-type domain-containing protein n=1 Tax=Crocodylus porosus TaxID=8502 RepID=A0A7M4FRB8_CROPO